MARPLPPGIQPPPARRGWGWGRWLLLAVTLVGWAPVILWAAGLILADSLGCRVGSAPTPCPSPFGDIGGSLYAITTFGGWLMIPAGIVILPIGLIWVGIALARAVRRARRDTNG